MALPLTLSNLSATLRAVFNIDKFGIDASALTTTKTITITDTSITSPVDIIVPDEVYDATAWDGSFEVPTKNALRDKIQSISLTPGPTGDTGATGATGPTGPVGGAISIPFLFTTDTTNTDPGSGFIGFNDATQNLATIIHTDFLDSNGSNWDSVVMSFGDSTNTVKGHLRIFKKTDITAYLLFTISATVGHTGFNNIHVTCIGYSTANPFSAADNLVMCFERAGDVGATGATGLTGATGATGATGSSWDYELVAASDQTVTANTTLVDHADLVFPVLSGEVWYFEAQFAMSGTSGSGDGKYCITSSPAGFVPTRSNYSRATYTSTGSLNGNGSAVAFGTSANHINGGDHCINGDGSKFPLRVFGVFTTSADCNVSLQFASSTAGGTTTLHAGARLFARKIA